MEEDLPQPESEKPRFLLPDGCKDLVDALRLREQAGRDQTVPPWTAWGPGLPRYVTIPDPVSVKDLTLALYVNSAHLIHLLMEANVFATLDTQLEFAVACALCRRFGVTAHKAS